MRDDIFGCHHEPGSRGSLNEDNRKFKPDEKPVVDHLLAEGHDVASLKEGSEHGKVGDADVCGHNTEIKRLRGVGTASPENRVRERLSKSQGQGSYTVIDTRNDPRIKADHADQGVRTFLPLEARDKANGTLRGGERTAVRVIGKDFDASYPQSRLQEMRREHAISRPPTGPAQTSGDAPTPPRSPQPVPAREPTSPTSAPSTSRFAIDRGQDQVADRSKPPGRSFQIAPDQGKDLDKDSPRRSGPSK